MNHSDICKKNVLERADSQCKNPKTGACLVALETEQQDAGVAVLE